jgi:MOSC domain-containing protein YiiM
VPEDITKPYVVSINISPGGIPKAAVEAVRVAFAGLEGDGHNHEKHRTFSQVVCLQDAEKLEMFSRMGYPLLPGRAGENVTVRNLHVDDSAHIPPRPPKADGDSKSQE